MPSTFDMTKLRASVQRLGPYVKKTRNELVRDAAKGFVKDVVAITPPASKGRTGSSAKKAGELTIQGDLLKLAQPIAAVVGRGAVLASQSDLLTAHARARSGGRGGRVNPRNRQDKLLVAQAVFQRALAGLQKQVGWLSAGWNKAAQILGVRLPSWVTRHGSQFGDAKVIETAGRFRLELSNVVRFVGDVAGYERRVQKAIDYQAKKMDRQADFLIKKAVKEAGF